MKKDLVNKTMAERKEILRDEINNGVKLTLERIEKSIDSFECVEDVEKCIETQMIMYFTFKKGICEELGFSIERCNDTIEELEIKEIDWTIYEEKIEAKKKDLIEKNLEIFESISYGERWANDMRFIKNEDEFIKYVEYLISKHGADEELRGEFDGIGYYDYKWNTWAIRIAGLDYFYKEEIEDEISNMDKEVVIIRERKLSKQVEAYMDYLGLKRYEYTMDFKNKRHIDGIKRLENFLNEMRKQAFVFHKEVSSEEWKNEEINKDYIQMNGDISSFSFVYYIEEDKQEDLDFEIINAYERGVEEYIGQGRTC